MKYKTIDWGEEEGTNPVTMETLKWREEAALDLFHPPPKFFSILNLPSMALKCLGTDCLLETWSGTSGGRHSGLLGKKLDWEAENMWLPAELPLGVSHSSRC